MNQATFLAYIDAFAVLALFALLLVPASFLLATLTRHWGGHCAIWILCYGEMGLVDEARKAWREALRVNPAYSLEATSKGAAVLGIRPTSTKSWRGSAKLASSDSDALPESRKP